MDKKGFPGFSLRTTADPHPPQTAGCALVRERPLPQFPAAALETPAAPPLRHQPPAIAAARQPETSPRLQARPAQPRRRFLPHRHAVQRAEQIPVTYSEPVRTPTFAAGW